MDVATVWGTTPEERDRGFPCDAYLDDAPMAAWRAIDIAAPAGAVFRRLCQLRVAPYSYDWVDNFGRRSPERLIPGLDRLEVGQPFMRIFDLAEFEDGRSITLVLARARRVFGTVAVTYEVVPVDARSSRLVAKIVWRAGGPLARLLAVPAAWGDLVMMRRQFLNLRRLAEADAARALMSPSWRPPRTSLLPPPAHP